MFENFPLFPESASTISGQVDVLYLFLISISVFFSLLIAILIIYFAVKYRRGSKADRSNANHESMALELTWSIIPLVIALFIFVWGAYIYFEQRRPPAMATDIYVVGKQWMWKFQHSSGRREINELHIPVGTPIRLTMATEDVIHSFFVPAFRVKYDVVPGTYRTMWFQATKTGKFHLFCAEYCGTRHAGMGGWIYVMEPGEFQRWLSGSTGLSVAASGEKLFQELGCVTCHKQDATGRGPSLYGVFGSKVKLQTGEIITADENYLRESILNPQAKIVAGHQPIMPTYQGLVNEEGLLQIIAYIKTLHAPNSSPGNVPAQSTPLESQRKKANEVSLKQP